MSSPDGGSTAGFSTVIPHTGHGESLDGELRELPLLPTLTVLSHPDLDRIGERVFLGELVSGQGTLLSRELPHFAAPEEEQGRPLADRYLSRGPIRLEPADGGVRLVTWDSRTAVAVDGASLDGEHHVPSRALDEGVVLELAHRVVLLLHHHQVIARPKSTPSFALVGASSALERVREAITQVADVDVSVLVRGETGTGKELVARALHDSGPRRRGPFVSVNLGALTPSLAGADLFGSRKGAYTGATRDQPGYFGRADGGTLFLDEIGEAPPEVQAMLLRALETGEIVALGSQKPRPVDVRIVSATDADLDRLIESVGFRAPLLHRLAGYTLHLPPLRRRRDDIGRLLLHFLLEELARVGEPPPRPDPNGKVPYLPTALVRRLALYPWPGNVRQLRNVARQLALDSRGKPALRVSPALDALLPPAVTAPATEAPPAAETRPVSETPSSRILAEAPEKPVRKKRWRPPTEVSEDELVCTLRAHRWNLKATARALGISRTSLYALVKRSPRVRTAATLSPEEIRACLERHGSDLDRILDELEVSEDALQRRCRELELPWPTTSIRTADERRPPEGLGTL